MISKNVLVFGMSVKLDNNLGSFEQIKLKDLVQSDMELEELISPFVLDRKIAEMFESKKLFYVFFLEEILKKKDGFLDSLKKSLSFIYKTENIIVDNDNCLVIIDEKYILDADNFEYLCNSICRLFMVNRNEIQRSYDKERDNANKEETETDRKFREMRERSLRNRNKSKEDEVFTLTDMANYLVHCFEKYTYENIQDLTIWQLKNSFNLYQKKDGYRIEMMYRTSGSFEMKNEVKHWFL